MQVLPELHTGGVERGTVEIAAALVAQGWPSLVTSAGGAMVRDLKYLGAEHVRLPLARKGIIATLYNALQLHRLIRRNDVALVHARSRAPAWSALIAARRNGKPFLTTYHGTYAMGGLPFKRWYNSVMAKGDKVIAISEFVRNYILTNHPGVPPEKIVVIHRGVDTDVFSPETVPDERVAMLRSEWNVPDNAFCIMLPGRLTSWKGQQVLLEALTLLPRDIPWIALMVGSAQGRSKYQRFLQDYAMRHDIAQHVRFVGNCDDMPAAYRLADVMVSASKRPEAFGRVITEAQAMACPVIATNHGGAAESVLDGTSGTLIPPDDAQALADALLRLQQMPLAQRQAMGQAGRQHVAAHFSLKSMQQKTLALYREMLGLPPLPAEVVDEKAPHPFEEGKYRQAG